MNRLSIAMLALLLFAPLARGDDKPPPRAVDPDAKVSLQLEDVTLREALDALSVRFHVSVIIAPGLLEKMDELVSLKATDLTVLEILQHIAKQLGGRAALAPYGIYKLVPLGTKGDTSPKKEPTPTGESKVITIDLNEVPLVMALQGIARMAGLNVVVDASVASNPATRDLDVTTRRIDESARKILRDLAESNGLRFDEQADGVILIRSGLQRAARAVVQIHSFADLVEGGTAPERILSEARRMAPGATIRLQGRMALVIGATHEEQETVNDMLEKMRQIAAAQARAQDPNRTRLRYFDVVDLIRKYHKLPARMKRLFPPLASVEQRGRVLIVRGTPAQLENVTKDLLKLRDSFGELTRYAGRRNSPGEVKLPPVPPPSGAPVPPIAANDADGPMHVRRLRRDEHEELERQRKASDEARAAREEVNPERRIEREAAKDAARALEIAAETLRRQQADIEWLALPYKEAERRAQEPSGNSIPVPTEVEWERAARGPQTLEQRIESLHAEVRALRQEVRELRALLEPRARKAPK